MSTPRTDAAAKEVRSTENGILVRADFARQLETENAALREQVAKFNDPACLHNHCVRTLTDAQVAHLFGERMTAIQNDRNRLEAENAALRKENNIELERATHYREQWQKAQAVNAALLDLIEDLAHQNFHTGIAQRDYNGQVANTMVTDSGALTANGEALRRLADANPPRFRIVAEGGRMVVGYWPENDPQKEAQP